MAAKAVVVATGGYANNKEWIKKYTGYDLGVDVVPIGNTGKTGDGIRMAWEAGAAEEGVGTLELFRVAPLAPEFATWNDLEIAAAQPDLVGDRRGRALLRRDRSVSTTPRSAMPTPGTQGDGYTFSILDDSILERHGGAGHRQGRRRRLPARLQAGEYCARRSRPPSSNGSRGGVRGRSVEDWPRRMGADPAALRATVDEYNRCCAQGYDESLRQRPRATCGRCSARVLRRPGPHRVPGHHGRHQGQRAGWKCSTRRTASSPGCTPADSTPAACTATATPSRARPAWLRRSRSTLAASPAGARLSRRTLVERKGVIDWPRWG